jgi:hypothetical protein
MGNIITFIYMAPLTSRHYWDACGNIATEDKMYRHCKPLSRLRRKILLPFEASKPGLYTWPRIIHLQLPIPMYIIAKRTYVEFERIRM